MVIRSLSKRSPNRKRLSKPTRASPFTFFPGEVWKKSRRNERVAGPRDGVRLWQSVPQAEIVDLCGDFLEIPLVSDFPVMDAHDVSVLSVYSADYIGST